MTNENQQTIDAIIGEMNEILSFGKRAENTLITYRTYAFPFLEYCFEELKKSPYEATEKDVRSFIITIQADRELGDRTVNLIISSIHNLFQSVLDIPWNKYKVPFRSFDEYIPFVPGKEELETFISSTPDLKRKAVFAIMFAAGLRVSEACSLHCGDIVMSKKAVRVRPSKRRKERYIGLYELSQNSIFF
jgi:site-specific recombinase XerD